MEEGLTLLPTLITRLPIMSVWSVGIVVALVFWRRHSRVSTLTSIACAGFLILAVSETFAHVTVLALIRDGRLNTRQFEGILAMINILTAFLYTILWILVLIAIFGWRKTPEMPNE